MVIDFYTCVALIAMRCSAWSHNFASIAFNLNIKKLIFVNFLISSLLNHLLYLLGDFMVKGVIVKIDFIIIIFNLLAAVVIVFHYAIIINHLSIN